MKQIVSVSERVCAATTKTLQQKDLEKIEVYSCLISQSGGKRSRAARVASSPLSACAFCLSRSRRTAPHDPFLSQGGRAKENMEST